MLRRISAANNMQLGIQTVLWARGSASVGSGLGWLAVTLPLSRMYIEVQTI